MSRALFDSLGEVHRYDDLEDLLDYVAGVLVGAAGFTTALITFYFGEDVSYGAAGCPPDVKERFREAYRHSLARRRLEKRALVLEYGRPGTNICFIPAGEGPEPASAYVPARRSEGTWQPDDRLLVFMRDWRDEILGVLSLDNPASGNRPNEADFRRLKDVDRYVNVVAKIAENRFWSLRLGESEQAYRSVFHATTDALLILEREGRIVETNPAASRLYGLAYEDLVGSDVKRLLPPAEHDRCDALLSRLAEGFAFRIDARQLRADGRAFQAEVHGTALHFRGKLRLLTFSQDVTEKKQLFRRLLEEQKEESVVAIAGGVAHDFNNILMGITGSTALLLPLLRRGSEATRHAERIAASADRLAHLTGQLLAIARGVHSEPHPVTLVQIVRDNLALIKGMTGAHYELEIVFPDRPWTVVGDRVQLGQVLLNLTQNACEAMERGGRLRLDVQNVTRREGWSTPRTGTHPPGSYVALVVEDAGSGMDETALEHLFEPYFSTKVTGSGLGLAAVLGIVRRHQGSLGIRSRPGQGTRIEILLPRSEVEAEADPSPTPPQRMVIARPRILLVEDEDLVRQVTREMLEDLGSRVVTVSSGAEALETYRADPKGFDLVLLDVTMPGMSGVEVSEALLEMDPTVRVVLSSGHTERLVREHLPPGGAIAGFLHKPYQMHNLEEAVVNALRRPRETSAGPG